jgi:cysteine desulfurase/selenocysteine lyase
MQLPAPHRDFIGFHNDTVHLATGGQPPLLKAHEGAFAEFAADKARGQAGYENHLQVGAHAKRLLATLTGIVADDHAFVGSASEGINKVISAVDWRAGDNVVVADKDYASGRFSMLRLAKLGVEARVVKSDGWLIDPEQLLAACDDRTRMLYISQVTSLTGQRFDIAYLSQQLAGRDIVFLVDASHALGVIPVDANLADFTISSCYKFLCATHMGVLAWNRRRRPDFDPLAIGWASAVGSEDGRSYTLHRDAARAQSGNPNHLDVYILKHSLEYLLGFGLPAINAHVMALSDRLHEGLRGLDLEMITPAAAAERAANVAFASAADRDIRIRAANDGIHVWDGNGRVRASAHLFNSEQDVERYIEWLAVNVAR